MKHTSEPSFATEAFDLCRDVVATVANTSTFDEALADLGDETAQSEDPFLSPLASQPRCSPAQAEATSDAKAATHNREPNEDTPAQPATEQDRHADQNAQQDEDEPDMSMTFSKFQDRLNRPNENLMPSKRPRREWTKKKCLPLAPSHSYHISLGTNIILYKI